MEQNCNQSEHICSIYEKLHAIDKRVALLEEAVNGIKLLGERRTALISAAVTGKIDVRNYASIQKDAA